STPEVAYLMSTVIMGGMALQWPIGRLSDRFDRRRVVIGVSLSVAIVSASIAAVAREPTVYLFPLGFLFGGFVLTIYSLCVAHTNDFVAQEDLVAASGGLLFAFGLGALLGPLLASEVIAIVGPR